MTAFWRRAGSAEAPVSHEAPSAGHEAHDCRARGFSDLVSARMADVSVLDFGPGRPPNLAFFLNRGATYRVEEVYRSLEGCRRGTGFDPRRVADQPRLLDPDGTVYDVVLAWDLVDYLGAATEVLATRLEPLVRRGSRLHLLVTRQPTMPPVPRRWEVAGEDVLRFVEEPGPEVGAPRLKQPDLERLLAPWQVERAYLLKEGLDEYVWRLPG